MARLVVPLAAAGFAISLAASAQAASGVFDRAWGKDVDIGGGAGFEICTVAANCKTGSSATALGGELANPFGVAVDATGNVYVTDTTNDRVQKFDSSGHFLRAWGKDVDVGGGAGFEICTVPANCQVGSEATALGGELSGPFGIAADTAGNVYVADSGNDRIQKFDSGGNFLGAWGKNVDAVAGGTGFEVCALPANCKAGDSGSLGGELSSPRGIATDAVGNVYVGETNNQRIQKFDPNGVFVRAWGKDVDTGGGAGPEICTNPATCKAGSNATALGGELSSPGAIAIDSAGNVYVAEQGNHRISKFDLLGNFQLTWGKDVDAPLVTTGFEVCTVATSCKAGSAASQLGGELNQPRGVAAGPGGRVYVGDTLNSRIQVFSSTGTFLQAWGKDVDTAGGTGPEVCTVAANCQLAAVGPALGGEFDGPSGVAANAAGDLYVADRQLQRIQKFADPLPPPPTPTPPVTSAAPAPKKCKKGQKLKNGKCIKKKGKKKR